ncbi:MAG TPA: DUF1428 domain-containing protein [Rubrivivax sp.]|nr:DUF1428 domain-containing protein [Rubrivivax sp.]
MLYIDGFVAAVADAQRETYIRYAAGIAARLKQHGALRVVECWGDDVPEGKLTSFPMAVKREPGETVVFAWIAWPDKATRDAAHAKMAADPLTQPEHNPMPFDGRRLIYGGFQTVLDV